MDPSSHSAKNLSDDCPSDSEIEMSKICACKATTIKIVTDENDWESLEDKTHLFKPVMMHQIFGDSEMIFGYRQLAINLYFMHNSYKCYVNITHPPKSRELSQEADNVLGLMTPWLPKGFITEKPQFIQELKGERHDAMFGVVMKTFKGPKNEEYKITLCETRSEDFVDFHQRFETMLVYFIDGANAIDLDDFRWIVFYVYEEIRNEETQSVVRSPVGLCTAYKFFNYPDKMRARISQIFILPTHQRKGIASQLYSVVYNYLKVLPNVRDITVEEPTPIFQKIRDFADSLAILNMLKESELKITSANQKAIQKLMADYKLCTKQSQRVLDILQCLTAHKNGYKEYVKFTQTVKARIAITMEQKDCRGTSKRLCKSERISLCMDPANNKELVDAEYAKYIESLEWPVSRLRAAAAKS